MLGLGLATDPLVALGTDAVRRLPDELFGDPRLTAADRIEPEPFVADLELLTPRAVEEQLPAGPRIAQNSAEPGDAGRVDCQRASPLLRPKCPCDEILVQPQLASSTLNIAPDRPGYNPAAS